MELTEYWGSFYSEKKSVDSFFCFPKVIGKKRPAILLIQEIWGVDEHIVDMARRYATSGYFVAAPDLYSKGGKEASRSAGRITELKEFLDRAPMKVIMNPDERRKFIEREEPDRAERLIGTMDSIFTGRDMQDMVKILDDTVSLLHERFNASSVGTVGYCMGGALSFLMARNPGVSGSVVYYGTAPGNDDLMKVKAPVMGFYGGEDHGISDAVPSVADKMNSSGKKFQYQVYQGAQHAFFNDTRASYGYEAARDAWGRTLEFFRENLK